MRRDVAAETKGIDDGGSLWTWVSASDAQPVHLGVKVKSEDNCRNWVKVIKK